MKKRLNLVHESLSGESSSVDVASINEFRRMEEKSTKFDQRIQSKDKFNVDVTGLFFQPPMG